jgi:hypothetical protein
MSSAAPGSHSTNTRTHNKILHQPTNPLLLLPPLHHRPIRPEIYPRHNSSRRPVQLHKLGPRRWLGLLCSRSRTRRFDRLCISMDMVDCFACADSKPVQDCNHEYCVDRLGDGILGSCFGGLSASQVSLNRKSREHKHSLSNAFIPVCI